MSSYDNFPEEEASDESMPGYRLLEQYTFNTLLVNTYTEKPPRSSTPISWKYFWYQRIHLIWFQKLEWDWQDIKKWFEEIGLPEKTIEGWKKLESRATSEINTLGNVMAADNSGREERLNELMKYMNPAAADEYDNNEYWERIYLKMKTSSSSNYKWTKEKLQFVWRHGVAVLGEFNGLGPHPRRF